MTAFRIALLVIALMGGTISSVYGTIIAYKMVEQVNQKLEPSQAFDNYGWWLGKKLRLTRQYRRFYPDGKLDRQRKRVIVVAFSFWALVAYCSFGRW